MKSKKALELLEWLSKKANIIDQPRMFTEDEVKELLEICELEVSKDKSLNEKCEKFKESYNFYKDYWDKATKDKKSTLPSENDNFLGYSK